MAGLIDSGEQLEDPILERAERALEAKVQPEMMDAYKRIVVAGMKVMFDQATHAMMVKALHSNPDIVKAISEGIAALMAILYRESKNTMPMSPAMFAMVTLMLHALDYAEKTMGAKVTPELVAQCTQAASEAVLRKFGVKPQDVNSMLQKTQGALQNPQVMAQLKQGA